MKLAEQELIRADRVLILAQQRVVEYFPMVLWILKCVYGSNIDNNERKIYFMREVLSIYTY